MTLRQTLTAALMGATMLAPAAGQAADYVLKFASPAPFNDADTFTAWLQAFEAGVEERTDGAIDVELYPAGQLGPIPATIEGTMMGTIEAANAAVGFFGSIDPRFSVLDSGGLFDDGAHALRSMEDPEVKKMLAEFGQDAGVEVLYVQPNGEQVVFSTKPIESVADFEGLKLRTGGATPLVNRPFEMLGVSPVAMSLGDVIPGLQTGTIDAATINFAVGNGLKVADVAEYGFVVPGQYTMIGGIISADFMEMIGPDLAQDVRDAASEANQAYYDKFDALGTTAEDAFAASGGTPMHLDDAAAEEFRANMTAEVERVVAENPQMQADYDVLKSAAERTRGN